MTKVEDNSFSIVLDKFYQGFSPLAFQNTLTEIGGGGHASTMTNVDVINGDYITQGPALTILTNSTEAGVVNELLSFVMDKAVTDSVTYGIGPTQLFKITPTALTDDATWPQVIPNSTSGESIQVLKGNLYYFFNKSATGEIGRYNLDATFTHDWGSTTPTGGAALENAPHPSEKKEDIILFGNGRYVGSYIAETNTLAPTKLDFGNDAEVADISYSAGYWYIAVNSGVTGDNRTEGQIFLYDGSATVSTLADETGVGMQRIGFLYRINGIIYVMFQDLSSDGLSIGYIFGTQIKPLGRLNGTLPNFQQKTLYKNTILTLSSAKVYSGGALIEEFPFQVSQFADGGYSTVGAIATPFGTPIISSHESAVFTAATSNVITSTAHGLIDTDTLLLTTTTTLPAGLSLATKYYVIEKTANNFKVSTSEGGSEVNITGTGSGIHTWNRYKVAKFSGYDTNCDWTSIVVPLIGRNTKGYIDNIAVLTPALGENAQCDLTVEANQGVTAGNELSITGTGKTLHSFTATGLASVEDFRIKLDWSNGSSTNPCSIRRIIVSGHFLEG